MPARRRIWAIYAVLIAVLPALAGTEPVDRAENRLPPAASTQIAVPADLLLALKQGLDSLDSGDVASAGVSRDSLPASSLERRILTWAIALKGGKAVASGEIAAAARSLGAWPGMDVLRRNSERALFAENPDPQRVIQAFAGTAPQTPEGAIILARAHVVTGDIDGARTVLSPFWRREKLDASDESAIIREFGAVIPVADHLYRMQRMLYGGRTGSAKRVAPLADAEALCNAWIAAEKGGATAKALLDAVPIGQRTAGYIFAQTRYLHRAHRYAQAADMMLTAPRTRAALVDPDAWWMERRTLSRQLLDNGDAKTAYTLVAAHAGESFANQADAEFHAGWYALRTLNDPVAAASHFHRLAALSTGPLSLSRAYYWLGRAAEASDPGDAREDFARAAAFGTTFYGQLAGERIGVKTITISDPIPTEEDRVNLAARETSAAIDRLELAGHQELANLLYRTLADQIDSPGELALLAKRAEQRGNHYIALRIAKVAAGRGIEIGMLSHPVGAIPETADIPNAGKALAYAVARQESEFNVSAVSPAGARGLLQLLPATAKEVAKRSGIAYSSARLVTDPGYNATLGAAFLGEQLARFNGSYVLTFAGYNAGPRRAQEWMARYGDPRGKDVDTVVDWIERIPYSETRSYVQRVMENYQVYKMRLTGSFDIAADLVHGG